METTQLTHPFERVGLGKAPFKYAGHTEMKYQACPGAPVQPGGTCDYCGTAIVDAFFIKSSDGKTFHVGSDCVGKLSRTSNVKGDPVLQAIHAAANRLKLSRKHARDDAKIAELKVALASDDVRARLSAMPHPLEWKAAAGATRLEWAEWMMAHAGTTGRLQVKAFVDSLTQIGA